MRLSSRSFSYPLPYYLGDMDLREYNELVPEYHDWSRVNGQCNVYAAAAFDAIEASPAGILGPHKPRNKESRHLSDGFLKKKIKD